MAGDVAFFAAKTIGMSKVNGRKPCDLLTAARHNLREIQAELGATGRIHPSRSADNVLMAGPDTAEGVQALANSLLATVDTSRLKRDHVQALELVFGLPPGFETDHAAYFAKCLEWAGTAFGLPVLSMAVHRDEAATHAHVLLLPVKDGRHVGGAPIARAELLRLREAFFVKVAGPAGLKRDGAKLRGASKALAVAAVLERCEAMGLPAANGPLWPVLLAAIERDPTAAVLALGVDLAESRKTAKHVTNESPIGLQHGAHGVQASPIGLQKAGQKEQALSCVGLGQHTPPKPAPEPRPGHAPTAAEPAIAADRQHPGTDDQPEPISTVAELWERVGCKLPPWQVQRVPAAPQSQTDQPRAIESLAELWEVVGRRVVHSPSLHRDRLPPADRVCAGAADQTTRKPAHDRLTVAKAAQSAAIRRHERKPSPVLAELAVAGDADGGRVVDRTDCHDLTWWD